MFEVLCNVAIQDIDIAISHKGKFFVALLISSKRNQNHFIIKTEVDEVFESNVFYCSFNPLSADNSPSRTSFTKAPGISSTLFMSLLSKVYQYLVK